MKGTMQIVSDSEKHRCRIPVYSLICIILIFLCYDESFNVTLFLIYDGISISNILITQLFVNLVVL